MPIAAIEALVEALSQMPTSTVTETLMLLSRYSDILRSSISNPISLSAGTDLFQRYLVTSLQRSGSLDDDFHSIRRHLLTNGRLFVSRAQVARKKIAAYARHFVRDGNTVLTFGGSRVVGAVLQAAADDSMGSVRFRVIYVLGPNDGDVTSGSGSNGDDELEEQGKAGTKDHSKSRKNPEGRSIVRALRARGVPVATIPSSAVGFALGKVDMVIVGAEGVVESGGIISRLGTYQIGMLAKATGKPFYVVAESHKFVRLYPLGQYDMPIEQRVVQFRVDDGDDGDDGGKGAQTVEPQMYKRDNTALGKAGDEGAAYDSQEMRLATMAIRGKDRTFSDAKPSNRTIPANDLCDAVDFTVRIGFILLCVHAISLFIFPNRCSVHLLQARYHLYKVRTDKLMMIQ